MCKSQKTCGDCHNWGHVNGNWGMCWGNPDRTHRLGIEFSRATSKNELRPLIPVHTKEPACENINIHTENHCQRFPGDFGMGTDTKTGKYRKHTKKEMTAYQKGK